MSFRQGAASLDGTGSDGPNEIAVAKSWFANLKAESWATGQSTGAQTHSTSFGGATTPATRPYLKKSRTLPGGPGALGVRSECAQVLTAMSVPDRTGAHR